MDDQSTWTMDDSARASRPGNTKVNPFLWIRHYPTWAVGYFACLIGSLVLALTLHWSLWILFALMLGLNWFYWQRVKEHFLHGNVCPAIIVNLNPMMFAVLTDLSKGIGEYPAIKIIPKKFTTVLGKKPDLGARFPAVALYGMMHEDIPYWEEFDPRPLEFATSDQKTIHGVASRISRDDWKELDEMLRKVPRPFQPGLYELWQKRN